MKPPLDAGRGFPARWFHFNMMPLDPCNLPEVEDGACRVRPGQAQEPSETRKGPLDVAPKECGCVQELVYALCRALRISA